MIRWVLGAFEPHLCRGDAGGWGPHGAHDASLSPAYDQLPQSPQDHRDRRYDRLHGRHEHRRRARSGRKGFTSWRDTQVRIVGEGAAVLQTVFMVDWHNAVRENLFLPVYFLTLASEPMEGDVPVQILTSGRIRSGPPSGSCTSS